MQLDKSLEFINSALEKESEEIPNVSFGVEEVQEDKTEVTKVEVTDVTQETKVAETKEAEVEKVEVPKVIEKEVVEEKTEKVEKLKKPEEPKKEEKEPKILEESKKEEVSPQPKVEEKSSSFIKAMRQGQVVSPVVRKGYKTVFFKMIFDWLTNRMSARNSKTYPETLLQSSCSSKIKT